MVETDEPGRRLQYIVVLLSNVLRKDSAKIHKQLATEIHEMMERDHPAVEDSTDSKPKLDDGADDAAIQRVIDEINSEKAAAPVDEIDSDD
jgi:low affinity Fe/Cu permease